MKKLLLIAIIASCLGCSKSSNMAPTKTTSWIAGKWNCTSLVDTSIYFDGHKTASSYPGFHEELNFIDTSHVFFSTTLQTEKYSLSNMTITVPDYAHTNLGNDFVFKITKLSDNEIKLYCISASNGEIGVQNIGIMKLYTKE